MANPITINGETVPTYSLNETGTNAIKWLAEHGINVLIPDNELLNDSERPIQNSVVKNAFDTLKFYINVTKNGSVYEADKTYAEMQEAESKGKILKVVYDGFIYDLSANPTSSETDGYSFICVINTNLLSQKKVTVKSFVIVEDGIVYQENEINLNSIEQTTNKSTSITSESTDTQYPSAKAVVDFVLDKEAMIVKITSDGAGGYVSDTKGLDIRNAASNGKRIFAKYQNLYYPLTNISNPVVFSLLAQNVVGGVIRLRANTISIPFNSFVATFGVIDIEGTSNKTTELNSSSTNNQYPSAKAVYDYVQSAMYVDENSEVE